MTNLRLYTWTIYSCIVEPRVNMRHTFAKYLTNFANTNSRQNIANVSLLVPMLSTLDMWLVLLNYVLTLIKFWL